MAIDRVLPGGDVHRKDEHAQVLLHVGVAENTELGLSGCVARCGSWFGPRTDPKSQDIQALQDTINVAQSPTAHYLVGSNIMVKNSSIGRMI